MHYHRLAFITLLVLHRPMNVALKDLTTGKARITGIACPDKPPLGIVTEYNAFLSTGYHIVVGSVASSHQTSKDPQYKGGYSHGDYAWSPYTADEAKKIFQLLKKRYTEENSSTKPS